MAELLKLRRARVTPPGGWRYPPIPDNGLMLGPCTTKQELVLKVERFYAANDLPCPSNIGAIVEDWICRQIPVSMTSAGKPDRTGHMTTITTTAAQKATEVLMMAWKKDGRKSVSIAESSERARTCLACEFNTKSGCPSCYGLNSWVRQWLGKTTKLDKQLKLCSINGTMNLASVHVSLRAIRTTMSDQMLKAHPDNCWKKAILEENSNGK